MNKGLFVKCALFGAVMALAVFSSCESNGSDSQNGGNAKKSYAMEAPVIQPNAAGWVTLSQLPTEDPHLLVYVSKLLNEAIIFHDGSELQVVSDPEGGLVSECGKVPVRFLDANFDGCTDIFIGPGESRTYSTLLVWDAKKKQFQRVGTFGDPTFQGFMLHPATKSVVMGGSDSASTFIVARSEWKGNQLKPVEQLTIVTQPTAYAENHVSNKYTLTDNKGKVTVSSESLEDLPETWRGIVKTYGF